MLNAIKEFFLGKPKAQEPAVVEAPYKVEAPVAEPVRVETPAPAKCGCGRSQSGFCVGLHKLTPEEWAVHSDNPNKAKPAQKAATKKPAAPKAKAPARPRAKKTPKQ
jgi:hypothetical protein